MDFSFLNDPDWQGMRETQWALDEECIKIETTKSKVAKIKDYYFTGKVKKIGDLQSSTLIRYFPKPDIEGFEYCFLNNIEEVTDDAFLSIQRIFASMGVPHITEELKLILFKHIFGDQFSEQREFPFPIGKTQKTLIINLGPHYFFSGATQRYIQKCTRVGFPRSFWFANERYFFSLFDHLDPIIFSIMT